MSIYNKSYIVDLIKSNGYDKAISTSFSKEKLINILAETNFKIYRENGYEFCLLTNAKLKEKLNITTKNKNFTKTKLINMLINRRNKKKGKKVKILPIIKHKKRQSKQLKNAIIKNFKNINILPTTRNIKIFNSVYEHLEPYTVTFIVMEYALESEESLTIKMAEILTNENKLNEKGETEFNNLMKEYATIYKKKHTSIKNPNFQCKMIDIFDKYLKLYINPYRHGYHRSLVFTFRLFRHLLAKSNYGRNLKLLSEQKYFCNNIITVILKIFKKVDTTPDREDLRVRDCLNGAIWLCKRKSMKKIKK